MFAHLQPIVSCGCLSLVGDLDPDTFIPFARGLPTDAVDRRITSVLTHCSPLLSHIDVNNEMLHGGYFQRRGGPSLIVRAFQLASLLAPSALLFLNDYHVEDGLSAASRPEAYAAHARKLLAMGAPVSAIGIQAHTSAPVGSHMRHSFDILSAMGLPLWLTELDTASRDERVQADDLEGCLREAFAHPGVHGVVLWGFMEGAMSRANAHLMRADGSLTLAGRRFEELLAEWKTQEDGMTSSDGTWAVQGYKGQYELVVKVGAKEIRKHIKLEDSLRLDLTLPE